MKDDLVLLVSAAAQLYKDGHRELATAVNQAINELQTDYPELIEDLFTAMSTECANRARKRSPVPAPPDDVVETAARFSREWPDLAKAVDALMRTSLVHEFPWITSLEKRMTEQSSWPFPTTPTTYSLPKPQVLFEDKELDDLAHSACQEALSFGLSTEVFLRYFKTIRDRTLRARPPIPEPLTPDEAQQKANHRLGVHLSHCNFGEYENRCKYCEDETCPALEESWSWIGKAIQERDRLRDNRKS